MSAPHARQAWRQHITGLLDDALARNDTVLDEIADYVLDNAGRLGDASLDIPGLDEPMAPTSTIVGAALIHAAWAGAAERLVAAGRVPEVWGSANRGIPEGSGGPFVTLRASTTGGRLPSLGEADRGPAASSSW